MIEIQYLGGKSRIAKKISEVINNEVSRREKQNCFCDCISNRERESNLTFVSLFCGSCAVESKIAKNYSKVICNDNHYYLIEMYKALQNGWIPPDDVTYEEYYRVKNNIDENPAYSGFVGFGSSFGGKWWGGYGRSKYADNNRNRSHAAESKRALARDMPSLMNAEFICKDYHDVIIPDNSIVYADPPYNNTTGYGSNKFNSGDFWNYMREISINNKVFISEQTAPEDFECVWEKPFLRQLDVNKQNQFVVTEKLFTYRGGLYDEYKKESD